MIKHLLQKISFAVMIVLFSIISFTVFSRTSILLANSAETEDNEGAGIEPEVYIREENETAKTANHKYTPSTDPVQQAISKANAAIKAKDFDEADKIADNILMQYPDDGRGLILKNRIRDIRHTDIISEMYQINETERQKNKEVLDEMSIPYTELMRFPKNEDREQVQNRLLPDNTEQFNDMKDETSKKLLIPNPRGPVPKKINDALNTLLSLEFYETPLPDVIAFIREKTGVNIILDSNVPQIPVTIKLGDVPIKTALKYILPPEINYEIKDDIVLISSEKSDLRVYDIRDLLINIDDNGKGESRTANNRVEELMRLIIATIEPASWSPETGRITTREDRPGDLIVVNVDRVHKQIEDVLTSMRSTQHLMVNIEARFIQMTDKFLEDIGIELQNAIISNPSSGTNLNLNNDTSAGGASSIGQGLDLTYSILKDYQIDILLKAVQESEDAQTLTSPRITLSNTQKGSIRVVNEISYVATYEIISSVPQPSIAKVEDGTTFDVRPIVSADRKHVFLEVHPNITIVQFDSLPFPVAVDVSRGSTEPLIQTFNLTIEQPRVSRQELSVTVDIPDRGTLMIGGLGTTQKTKKNVGTPILSKIPFIKRLFSRDSETVVRTNLIILLKPTILIREEEEKLQNDKELTKKES